MNLRIQENTENMGYKLEGLEIKETVTLQADSFMEVCEILGQFHHLAGKIKKEKEKIK